MSRFCTLKRRQFHTDVEKNYMWWGGIKYFRSNLYVVIDMPHAMFLAVGICDPDWNVSSHATSIRACVRVWNSSAGMRPVTLPLLYKTGSKTSALHRSVLTVYQCASFLRASQEAMCVCMCVFLCVLLLLSLWKLVWILNPPTKNVFSLLHFCKRWLLLLWLCPWHTKLTSKN